MGYTHYWKQPRTFTAAEWADVMNTVVKIVRKSDVPIADAMGEGVGPELRDNGPACAVSLNGLGEDSHETFAINQQRVASDSCKTARKPYDEVVTAVLIYLQNRYGWIVSSDGDPDEWMPGWNLLMKAFPPFVITLEE